MTSSEGLKTDTFVVVFSDTIRGSVQYEHPNYIWAKKVSNQSFSSIAFL